MNTQFDPYRKWLGIPPKDQPPNHYRLLGIELFESDPDVISNAADARMAHVRSFQTGPHSNWSQKILNEIAAAKVCLLNPEKKAQYDAQLRTQLAAQGVWTPPGAPMVGGMPESAEASLGSFSPGQPGILPDQASGQEQREGELWASGATPSGLGPISSRSVSWSRLSRRRSWQSVGFLVLGVLGVVVLAVLLLPMVQEGSSELGLGGGQEGQPKSSTPSEKTSEPTQGTSSAGPFSKETSGSTVPKEKGVSEGAGGGPSESKSPPGSSSSGGVSGKEKQDPSSPPDTSGKESGGVSKAEPSVVPSSETLEKEKNQPGGPSGSEVPEKEPMAESSSPEEKPEKPAPKMPPPPAADLAKVEQEIRSLFKEDFEAGEKGQGQAALAEKLLQHAQETTDSPAAQYMLFQLGGEWAARAGDSSLLHRAVDGLAQRFEVQARELAVAALEKAAGAPGEETVLRSRLELIQSTAEEILAEDDYPMAGRLAKAAQAISRKIKDPEVLREAQAWANKLERLAQEYAKLQEQISKLSQNPQDPEANSTVGRWYVFQAGQWDKGLPYLAKGNQPDLAEAARRDLEGPQDASAQQKLGDLWWLLSEKASGEEKLTLQGRAVYWYEQALPHLTGLAKTAAQRRLETYQNSQTQKESGGTKKGEVVLFFDGQKTYATVPNVLYDGTKPLTVEVILRADSAKHDGAIVGNLTSMGGWALALAQNPNRSSSERYWAFFFQSRVLRSAYSEEPVQIGQRVMLAAVYDQQAFRLFVNGRRQYPASSVIRPLPGPPTLWIGASPSPTGSPANFFHGTIEQIRISYIVRYTSHFTPPARLEKDKDTELLLHFDTGQAVTVRDGSGARRAARIVAGKWVRRELSP